MATFNLKSFVIATLRRASYRYKPRQEVKVEARVGRNQYKCSKCGGIFGSKQIKIDHIQPVVPLTGWISFDNFIERLFCEKSGLQVLCTPHHKEKTLLENQERKRLRNK